MTLAKDIQEIRQYKKINTVSDSRLSTGLKSEFMTGQCVFKIYYQVSLLFAEKIKSSWTFSSCKVLIKD